VVEKKAWCHSSHKKEQGIKKQCHQGEALEASHIMGVRHQGLADGFPPSRHHPENQYQESEVMDSPLFVSICQVFPRPFGDPSVISSCCPSLIEHLASFPLMLLAQIFTSRTRLMWLEKGLGAIAHTRRNRN
jgi:hypothetical protein